MPRRCLRGRCAPPRPGCRGTGRWPRRRAPSAASRPALSLVATAESALGDGRGPYRSCLRAPRGSGRALQAGTAAYPSVDQSIGGSRAGQYRLEAKGGHAPPWPPAVRPSAPRPRSRFRTATARLAPPCPARRCFSAPPLPYSPLLPAGQTSRHGRFLPAVRHSAGDTGRTEAGGRHRPSRRLPAPPWSPPGLKSPAGTTRSAHRPGRPPARGMRRRRGRSVPGPALEAAAPSVPRYRRYSRSRAPPGRTTPDPSPSRPLCLPKACSAVRGRRPPANDTPACGAYRRAGARPDMYGGAAPGGPDRAAASATR